MVRLSVGSWKNVRSLLGAGLNQAGGNILPGRFDFAPSPAWAELLGLVRGTRHLFHLGRFARYATQAGIAPEEVNDAVLARYTQLLVTQSLTGRPLNSGRETVRSWNAARERFPQWPQQALAVPDNRIRRSLDWAEYPATLRAEVERWIDWLGRDPFLDRDFRPLKPLSWQSRRRYLSLYLGALVEDGVDPATMTALAPLVAPAVAKRALSHVYRRQGNRTSLHLSAMVSVVLIIARHWAKLPASEVEILRRLSKTLRPDIQGLAPRNEVRLAQMQDPRQQDLLINLPQRLAERARKGGKPTPHLARIMQTAVANELLLMTALRISNLAGLSIGQTLLLHHDGRASIAIPADQVKNSLALTADLPPGTAALVREYIRLYRPLLGDASGPWLFPGAKPGTQKTTGALRDQISGAIARECGLEFHPHLFRHFLAAVTLSANAAHDGLVTRALGHKRQETTRSHYVGFQTRSGLQHYDALIERRRREDFVKGGTADGAAPLGSCRPALCILARGRPRRLSRRLQAWQPLRRRRCRRIMATGHPSHIVRDVCALARIYRNRGVALATEDPAERVTPERLERYRRMLMGRCASVTVASYLGHLLIFMADLWPDRDWRWLREIQAAHQRMAQPSRVKAVRMVDQKELVELGFSLMEQAAARPMPPDLRAGPSHPALLFRDGLMIALLALRPLRQGNFLNLMLGRHLQRTPDGWRIAIPASECKTGLALHMDVPAQLVPALETYLTAYRPALLTMRGPADRRHRLHPAGHALWVTRCGTAMTPGAQQKQLERHCRARFGHDINPHLFRDCAATTLAEEHPDGVSLAADLLGHRSTSTTQAYYIAANQRKALQQCQALILARRRPPSRRGRTP